MALLFKPYQSTVKDKFGDKLFYPRVQIVGNVSTKQIAKEIAEYCSLTPGDVKNTIDNLVRVMATHLQNSNSVTLDGFGTFRGRQFSAQGVGDVPAGLRKARVDVVRRRRLATQGVSDIPDCLRKSRGDVKCQS